MWMWIHHCGLCGLKVQMTSEGPSHVERPHIPHPPDLIETRRRLNPQINGRWGALVFWARGNDGLTYRQRRHLARQWAHGKGRLPSLEQSRRVYRHVLHLQAEQDHRPKRQEERR